jgi:hypothetical protein
MNTSKTMYMEFLIEQVVLFYSVLYGSAWTRVANSL